MRTYVLLISVVAACAAGGYAYAATSGGGGGAVDACAKTANGQLRLDTGDGCLPSETALQLGGASHVDEWGNYYGLNGGPRLANGVWPDIRGHQTVIQHFRLEPGQYLVSAEVLAQNRTGEGVVVCQIGGAPGYYTLAQGAVGTSAGFAQQQTLQQQGVIATSTPLDLDLVCWNATQGDAPAGEAFVNFYDMTATRIDSSTSNGVPN